MSLHDNVDVTKLTPPVLEFMKGWSKNMTSALHTAVTSRTDFGLFSPACLMHTSFGATHPHINGFNYYQAVGSWLFKRGTVPRVLSDDCGIICNPTCPAA